MSSTPAKVEPELKRWEGLTLADGTSVAIEAEVPHARLDELGEIALEVTCNHASSRVSGLEAIFGDVDELAARSPEHDETEVAVSLVGPLGSARVVEVSIMARSGEDLYRAYSATALWALTPSTDGLQLVKLWSGFGGEYHVYFDACLFELHMDYRILADGSISRDCAVTIDQPASSKQFPDCRESPLEECADEVIVPAKTTAR